jgi:hypothetical protein
LVLAQQVQQLALGLPPALAQQVLAQQVLVLQQLELEPVLMQLNLYQRPY